MTELRWILLLVGVLVIGAIYFFTRNRGGDAGGFAPDSLQKREPVIGSREQLVGEEGETDTEVLLDPGIELDAPEDADEQDQIPDEAVEDEPAPSIGAPEKIVTLRVSFGEEHDTPGTRLTELFRDRGLRYGQLNIFHKVEKVGDKNVGPVFSAANITEPGSFDLANIETQKVPGLTLFMILPNRVEGRRAFESMLDFAREVARQFDGEVLDESGSTLSIQRAGYIRDEIIDFERKRSIRHR